MRLSTFAITVNTNQSLVIHKSNIFRNEYVNVTALHKFSLNCCHISLYRFFSLFKSLAFFGGNANISINNLKPKRGEWKMEIVETGGRQVAYVAQHTYNQTKPQKEMMNVLIVNRH